MIELHSTFIFDVEFYAMLSIGKYLQITLNHLLYVFLNLIRDFSFPLNILLQHVLWRHQSLNIKFIENLTWMIFPVSKRRHVIKNITCIIAKLFDKLVVNNY